MSEWTRSHSSAASNVEASHASESAEGIRQQFRSPGWSAELETFDVLFATLKSHCLAFVEPQPWNAALKESPVYGQMTSDRTDAMAHCLAARARAEASAPLVYLNYGMPDTYEEQARRRVEVRSKIFVARDRRGIRGLTPDPAHQLGAIGCSPDLNPQDKECAQVYLSSTGG